MTPESLSFEVGPLTLEAQAWRLSAADTKTPILALHGWLDNCASFDPLCRALRGHPIVALDLAGHGFSSHRSQDSAYNLWQDVDDVLQVADQLGWQRFSLLGHSRGAMISVLIAAVAPERVAKVALIDGLVPTPVAEEQAVSQLQRAIRDKHQFAHRKRRRYPTLEQAAMIRTKGDFPLLPESAELMASRGVREDDKGFYWCSDPRLQGASEVKFGERQLLGFLQAVEAPVQLYLGEQGMGRIASRYQHFCEQVKQGELITLPGGHHLHMDGATAEMAKKMGRFF